MNKTSQDRNILIPFKINKAKDIFVELDKNEIELRELFQRRDILKYIGQKTI